MLLENSTLAEGSVDPARACPALGGCSKKFVSWGVRVGIKVLGGQHGCEMMGMDAMILVL